MKTVEKRQEIERKVIRRLIRAMKDSGWIVYCIFDGEERVKPFPVTEKAVLDTVFSVDECSITFKKAGFEKGCVAQIVLGNDGWDCIADHSYPSEDHEFVRIMDNEVYPYCEGLGS